MENLKIKIVITDGEKEAKSTITLADYKMIKELHGISMLDEQVDILLKEIQKSNNEHTR